MTPTQLQAEIARDPAGTLGNRWWRLRNLYPIRTKGQERRLLRFNPVQQDLARFMKASPKARPFVLKARQVGISTAFLLYHLDAAIFSKDCLFGVLSHSRESLGYLHEILRYSIEGMPDFVRPRMDESSKTAFSFADSRSRVFVSLGFRSTAVHRLHISEYAFIDPSEVEASLAAAGPDASVSAETTPNGMNHGFDAWSDSAAGIGSWSPLFFPWFADPTYSIPLNGLKVQRTAEEIKLAERALRSHGLVLSDEQVLFRRKKQRELKRSFLQEYPEDAESCFLSSGGTRFFDAAKIQILLKEAVAIPPVEQEADYVMWEKPQHRHVYAAGADTSEGGADSSVLSILCLTCDRQAFRFKARVGVDYFYKVCDKWGRAYNNALLGVERNNHGHAVLLGLSEGARYPNIFHDDKTRLTASAAPAKLGWATDAQSRPVMLDQLNLAVCGDSEDDAAHFQPAFAIHDQEFLRECLVFEERDGRFEAAPGKHDDTIFAWAIAWQMAQRLRRRGLSLDPSKIYVGRSLESATEDFNW